VASTKVFCFDLNLIFVSGDTDWTGKD